MRLDGRVAIVTGGGFGIGRTYAEALAREGAKVIIADVNELGLSETEQAIRAAGGTAMAVYTDVADQASTQAMAQTVADRFGRIDVLINNAAFFATLPLESVEEITIATWDRVMAVNLRGPFLCVQAVLPCMKQQQYGKIINISSASIFSGNPLRLHYVTSKAGLIGFSRSLARALGDYNICVNSLLPGSTASEGALEAYGGMEWFERGAVRRAIQRVMRPDDLVGAVLFLASSDSDFMTGQALVVDGGAQFY